MNKLLLCPKSDPCVWAKGARRQPWWAHGWEGFCLWCDLFVKSESTFSSWSLLRKQCCIHTLLNVCSNFSEVCEVLVTIKHFTVLAGRRQGEAEGPAPSPRPGAHTSAQAPLHLPVLCRLPVGCLLIDHSRAYVHPSRLSSYLTRVKRLPFESSGNTFFFLPLYPVQVVCRWLCCLFYTVSVILWLLCSLGDTTPAWECEKQQ